MARLIEEGIGQAEAGDRLIDVDTARRIAACLHRGLGGELERFAATGRIGNRQVARLELFYSVKGEPRFARWADHLRQFITSRPGAVVAKRSKPEAALVPPPLVNPALVDCPSCDSRAAVVYVRAQPDDPGPQPGLALQMQHQSCRDYVKSRLHRPVEATFADRGRWTGFRRLLAHLAICHNRRVVVHRLDRLPGDGGGLITARGARVLSATETTPHTRSKQCEFFNGKECR
jgi:hypothetical protein